MLDFMNMMGNHDERKVDTYEQGDVYIDTCLVTDSDKPYETAVEHPNYNNGTMIIVELYDTEEEAQTGHDGWVKLMTGKELPKSIKDVSSAGVVKFAEIFGVDLNEEHKAVRTNCKPVKDKRIN